MIYGMIFFALLAIVGEDRDRTILYFGSQVCPACVAVQPTVKQVEAEGWSVRYIDAERDRYTAKRFGVRQYPTLIVVQNGQEIDRIVGALPAGELRRRLTGGEPVSAVISPAIFALPPQSRRIAGPSRDSLLGVNHPANRAKPSPTVVYSEGRRSRIAESGVEAQQALIGINHPLYARYHPSQVQSKNTYGSQSDPVATVRPAAVPLSAHPLLDGLSPLPASPQSLAATVRIQVDNLGNQSVGTGTIIYTSGDDVFVLTCAHLFSAREAVSNSTAVSKVAVELFQGSSIVRVPARIIEVSTDSVDLALVSFRSSLPLAKVSLLPKGEVLAEHARVFSIGCDHGDRPSRRDSVIAQMNRYTGSANVEVAGAPVPGRSGGGLFDARGRLIGVCFAADSVLDEGLFVGPDAIHQRLDRFRISVLDPEY